jgi:hypothetical protein
LQGNARELAHEVALFVGERNSAEERDGVLTVLLLNPFDLADGRCECLFPADGFEAFAFDALKGAEETVGVVVLKVTLDTLGAEFASVEWELLPRLEANDLIVSDLELDAALLTAKAAMSFDKFLRFTAPLPAACAPLSKTRRCIAMPTPSNTRTALMLRPLKIRKPRMLCGGKVNCR